MLDEPYDSASLTALTMGVANPTDATIDQMLAAIDKISKYNDQGQFRRFTGNDYTTDLAKGNIAVAMAYSGDIARARRPRTSASPTRRRARCSSPTT